MRAALLFVACAGLYAQSPLDVGAGLDGQLDRYLTGIAKQQWEARAAAVAATADPWPSRSRAE